MNNSNNLHPSTKVTNLLPAPSHKSTKTNRKNTQRTASVGVGALRSGNAPSAQPFTNTPKQKTKQQLNANVQHLQKATDQHKIKGIKKNINPYNRLLGWWLFSSSHQKSLK